MWGGSQEQTIFACDSERCRKKKGRIRSENPEVGRKGQRRTRKGKEQKMEQGEKGKKREREVEGAQRRQRQGRRPAEGQEKPGDMDRRAAMQTKGLGVETLSLPLEPGFRHLSLEASLGPPAPLATSAVLKGPISPVEPDHRVAQLGLHGQMLSSHRGALCLAVGEERSQALQSMLPHLTCL